MKWIGLTGGIASGKSTVARLLESLGSGVIDADQISHQVSRFGEIGYEKIVSQFGAVILKDNQELDRKKIADIVFNNPEKKQKLEDILHPLIQARVLEQKENYKKLGQNLCFYDVPLLFEKKMQSQFDFVVTVWCDPEIQLQRLMLRNKLSLTEAQSRVENQMPCAAKISQSLCCIDNSGSEESLIQIVSNWFEVLPKSFK
jgi:dephospho-CoA kinase